VDLGLGFIREPKFHASSSGSASTSSASYVVTFPAR
jgi:hypothetical protein